MARGLTARAPILSPHGGGTPLLAIRAPWDIR